MQRYFHENRHYPRSLPVTVEHHENFSFFAHWHTDIELVLVEEGRLTVGVNHEKRQLQPGEMAVCASGDIHYFESGADPSRVTLVIFSTGFLGSPGKWPNATRFCSPFITCGCFFAHPELCRIRELIGVLEREQGKTGADAELFVRAGLLEICGLLLRYLPQENALTSGSRPNEKLELMQQILAYIGENFMNHLTLNDAAAHFNISTFYFCRLFKAVTGRNFKSYLNMLRISKAEEQLLNSRASITEIAFACGFRSIRTFNRVFREYKGTAPSRLR